MNLQSNSELEFSKAARPRDGPYLCETGFKKSACHTDWKRAYKV